MTIAKQVFGNRIVIAAAATFALAACGKQAEAPPSEPEQAASPEPADTGAPASIIRDDVDGARAEAPLSRLETSVSFGDNGDQLTEEALATIEEVLSSPQLEAGGVIVIGGHTDSSGSDEANLRVSKRRAEAVRDYLAGKGVAEERMTVIAFGEQNPVAPNADPDGTPNEEGRAANRRVEIAIEVPDDTPQAGSRPRTLVEQLAAPGE